MTTMPDNTHSSQMSTPISSLPLKTNQQETDIDDPLIQTVLKDFENDSIRDTRETQQHTLPDQQVYHVANDATATDAVPSVPNVSVNFEELNYNGVGTNDKKSLINYEIAKRAAIISIIAFLMYNQNIIGMLISKLPDSIATHINGKEFLIYILISFLILYDFLYFDLI